MTTQKKQRPTFLQAIAISGAGLLIALFGCLGALTGIGGNSAGPLAEAGIAGFVLGLLMFLAGGILLLVVIIRPFFTRQQPADSAVDRASQAPPAPASPAADPPGPPEGE